MRQKIGWQGPTSGDTARTYGDLFAIITHPAFRLGFLDAQNGKPFNHDCIVERIEAETPAGAMKRLGYAGIYWTARMIETAQYRYEEGRIAVIMEGLRCKAWGHPDFPPAQVREYIWKRADKTPSESAPVNITAALRGDGLPLFRPPSPSELGGGR